MVKVSSILLVCLQISVFLAVTEAICAKCFCIISFRPVCGLQERTGRFRVFPSVCVLNCNNKCLKRKYKFLGYGRCVEVINRIDKQKRKTTTTTTVDPIADGIRTTNVISSTTTTTKTSTFTGIANNNDVTTISTSGSILKTTTNRPSVNLTTTKEPVSDSAAIIRLID